MAYLDDQNFVIPVTESKTIVVVIQIKNKSLLVDTQALSLLPKLTTRNRVHVYAKTMCWYSDTGIVKHPYM